MIYALRTRGARRAVLLGTSTFLTPFLASGAQAQDAPPPAQLAMAEMAAEAPPSADDALGEIIVTATRTAEPLQRVPISMQALGAAKLEERQVNGLSDFAALLPSVTFEGIGPGRNTAFFRGIVPAGGAYASVGYYLDDIPITGTEVPDIHVYDMARIEALSGPQGTLYGAGSLAGTIRFITNKPDLDKFELGVDLEGNKYGKGDFGGQIESYVNIPATETLAVRAMGYYRRDGGYIDNTFNNGLLNNGSPAVYTLGDTNPLTSFALTNADVVKNDYNPIKEYGGRLQLLWEPIDGWEVTPQITAQRQIAKGYFGYDPRVGDLEVHDYDLTRNDDKWFQAQLSIHGHIGDWDVVSATGLFKRKTKTLNDYTYYTVTYDGFGGGYESYLQIFDASGCTGSAATLRCTKLLDPTQYYHADTRRDKFTQELRLTTPKDWPFDVTIGGFYQRQKEELNTYYAIRGLDKAVGYTAACSYSVTESCAGDETTLNGFGIPVDQGGTMILGTPAVKGDGFYIVEQDRLFHDYALFAEGHYNITPTLKLTGGIRYFRTDYAVVGFAGVAVSAQGSASTDVSTGILGGCPTPLPAERLQCLNTNRVAADQTGRYKEDGETHKVALNWQFRPDKMIYANYSTGFRPGGYNRPLRIRQSGITAAAPPFESETLTNFELGVKTTWNNVFRFNAAIYLEKWNNIQYSVVVAGAQGAGYTGNAGKAEVKGIEYDADLRLGKITISTSGAYNDGKLKGDFCNFAVDSATSSIGQLSTCALGVDIPGTLPPIPTVAAANGTRLPRQPKFKGTTSIRYDAEIGDYTGYLQGAALYQTGATQDLNVDNAALFGNTKGFVSFDFSAGVRKDSWSLTLFLQNAFDKRGQLTKNTFCSIDFCSGSSRTFPIKPQFFGIRLSQKFS